MKPVDFDDHFRPNPADPQGDWVLSTPAFIWACYGCLYEMSDDSTPSGQATARRVIADSVALFKAQRYPRADYLETWLAREGADVRLVFPVLVDACEAVGNTAVSQVVRRATAGGEQ